MDIPTNLPTDNFYKFVTLLGLVIAAVSVYGIARAYVDTSAEIKSYSEEFRRTEPTTRQLEVTNQIVQSRNGELMSITKILARFVGAGLGIASLGLILWYTLHQRHLDRILQLERAKAEAAYADRIGIANPSQKEELSAST